MQKRSKMPRRKSEKLFSRTAKSVHPKNNGNKPAVNRRGGIRL